MPLSILTRDLISNNIPFLRVEDKVYQALELMNENNVTHLPIADGEKFVGLISEDDLLQAENDTAPLSEMEQSFSNFFVKDNEHFLKAVKMAAEAGISVVPIVNDDNELIGAVTYSELLKHSSGFMSLGEPGGLVVLEMESNQYSFNELSRIVENNDTHITQLNTSNDVQTGLMLVTIRVNKSEISDLVSSFQRHEYNVKYFFGEEVYTNELKNNYDNLMNYLKV